MMAITMREMAKSELPDWHYRKKTIETLTDKELKNKICQGVKGGCANCEVNAFCRIGKEAIRRFGK